jgi:glycosyltransferase involved in cell wall biosynthesis
MANLSIILCYHSKTDKRGFARTIASLVAQNDQDFEVIVYGPEKPAIKDAGLAGKLRHIKTPLDSPSASLNKALAAASGEFVLICQNESQTIEFKKSAVRFYNLIMPRHPLCPLLYTDYDLLDKKTLKSRKLLEWHAGRLMDSWDMGYCLLFRRSFLQSIGYCNEQYRFKPLYDLRLKAFAVGHLVHVSNRFNGVPYLVHAAAKGLDVFDYLKAGKEVQLEAEAIVTDHLKRIDAYLAPGQNFTPITYTAEEESSFRDCIASVVIPVFNRPEFITAAIESVQAQTVQNIECVVVCNGGEKDPTVKAVQRYMPKGKKYSAQKPPVRLLVHDMNVLGLCFNDALQSSKAKYYIQLDSDDLLFPDAVEKILRVYDEDERIGMVIGSYQVFEKKSNGDVVPVLVNKKPFVVTHDEWTEENGRNNLLRINGAGAPRSIKIKVLKELGWFGMNDAPFSRNYGEDYELVNKCAERYRIGRVWDPIYKVVRHAGGTDHMIDQVTIDVNDNAKDQMRLEALHRRQAINTEQKPATTTEAMTPGAPSFLKSVAGLFKKGNS